MQGSFFKNDKWIYASRSQRRYTFSHEIIMTINKQGMFHYIFVC